MVATAVMADEAPQVRRVHKAHKARRDPKVLQVSHRKSPLNHLVFVVTEYRKYFHKAKPLVPA
jgi:hypothetical protein